MERICDPLPRAPNSWHYEVASDAGGERAAAAYTLIETAKLNGRDPEAYLREVIGTLPATPSTASYRRMLVTEGVRRQRLELAI